MSRTLVLMRHGKSGYPSGVADHERPLAGRGRRQATLAGQWIADEGLPIDVALCSTATRTRQTLECTGIVTEIIYLDEIYAGTPDDILEAVRIHTPPNARGVLVVGHAPGMPATALALDGDGTVERFPTSAYAVLSIESPWDRVGLDVDPGARLVGVRIPRKDGSD